MVGGLELAMELSRRGVVSAAESKLSRSLTEGERAGIERIGSLLRLDAICRVFNSPAYTSADVLADLKQISNPSK